MNEFVSLVKGGEELHPGDGVVAFDAGPNFSSTSAIDSVGKIRLTGIVWDAKPMNFRV